MKSIYPFREGNGHTARIWLDLILKVELYKVMNRSKVYKDGYLSVLERSLIKVSEFKCLLKSVLSTDINSCEVYMKASQQLLL